MNELKNVEFDKYAALKSSGKKQFSAVKQLEHYKECCEVLEAIAGLLCNTTCRLGGCPTFSCTILECCRDNGLEGCWQCGEFESRKKFAPLESIHGDCQKENLWRIKKLGLEKWTEHRCKSYVWQQKIS
jgi:hypothetical protein